MSDENKVLDLDELFGQARAVKIKWEGRTYELLRMEGISPKQAARLNALQQKSFELQKRMQGASDASDQDIADLEDLFGNMLLILCSDFPVDKMPFMMKMRAVQYYMEQSQSKKKAGKTIPA